MKKIIFFGILPVILMLALLVFTGCAGEEVPPAEPQGTDQSFQVTLTDDLGRELVIDRKPERIVSLAPSNTEMLFALGLGDYVVGVSEYCSYPDEALEKQKAGSFAKPNIEKIVALNPHLVVAVPLQDEELERLMELDIPVLVLDPTTLEEIYDALMLVGVATGYEENAEMLVSEMKERIEQVREKVSALASTEKTRVYYEVYADPLMSVGWNSVIHELIKAAGGENIFADLETSYPKISGEAVLERDPEVIIFPNYHGTEEVLADEITSRPGWSVITAVKEERVVGIDPDIVSRSGPRVVEAVEELATIIYPELK